MKAESHRWAFKARFRRHAFGFGKDPVLGGEGAVAFLERVSPALDHVDSSSGAIGTAVNHAITALVPIIANAPVAPKIRQAWLDRLWEHDLALQALGGEGTDGHGPEALGSQTPCDPRTLSRAARDLAAKEPAFAVEAGSACPPLVGAGPRL